MQKNIYSAGLSSSDWVRVRPIEEIEATLDSQWQLNGVTFTPEMAEFCGTTQRILRPLRRFVDERDLRVKRASGIVLLEGIMCQGQSNTRSCDRACFYLWRDEWLEEANE